jgi:uncharacterized membrane protein YbhN (UPF0104 family)
MLRKLLKALHEIGAVGVMGSFAACIVLVRTAPTHSLIAYAAARQGIASVTQWLLVPSLAVVTISGLLAIAANRAYIDAGWAWLKALLGISLFEGTLLTVAASARRAAELSALAASGKSDPQELTQVLHTEWGGLWLLLGLSLANILIAVWRPRFTKAR